MRDNHESIMKRYLIEIEINVDNIIFLLLFLKLAYWYLYICLYKNNE